MVTIWPLYEGSVRTSWYPVMDVLKTTSPKAVPRAPYASPRNARPSSSMSTAGSATDPPGACGGKFNVERGMRAAIWRTRRCVSSSPPGVPPGTSDFVRARIEETHDQDRPVGGEGLAEEAPGMYPFARAEPNR